MTAGSTDGRRARLASATRHAHATVDGLIRAGEFFADRARYGAFLKATAEARGPIDAVLAESRAAAALPHWRGLSGLIALDLADLGETPPPVIPAELASEAEAWGALYVLEGSSLGARQLLAWVRPLGFDRDGGARHLAQQADGARTWRAFVATLDQQTFSESEEAACAASATRVFEVFAKAYFAARRRCGEAA